MRVYEPIYHEVKECLLRKEVITCLGGGIGIRARLKIVCRKA